MIDLHVHTKRSHHGQGDLEDFVVAALHKNIRILAFVEHAPLSFDHEHRMTMDETITYLEECWRLKMVYAPSIEVLAGLEVDYLPCCESATRSMVSDLPLDFVLGAVHFIQVPAGYIRVWDYEQMYVQSVQQSYFGQITQAVESGIFDGIAHPDLILRSGISRKDLQTDFERIIERMQTQRIAYEVNCAGISKRAYDRNSKSMTEGLSSYPWLDIAQDAAARGVPLTVGSDAHEPSRLAQNVPVVVDRLRALGVADVAYFSKRRLRFFSLLSDHDPAARRSNQEQGNGRNDYV
jgi:histidinol-phosphatase (PHP family)